MVLELKSRAMQ